MRTPRVLACLLLVIATPAWSQPAEWRDQSSHKTTLVEVEDGVRLEVLDWGGSGQALLLLAGLGDSAHVFDDVAPTLAARYRVVGVTRRGHPRSSSPASGYTTARLAEDLVRVMDAVGLQRPVVVGHSFAGEEMHVLGARFASRIAGLVYVDAAFDRADRFQDYEAASRAMPAAPRPQPADLVSFTRSKGIYGGLNLDGTVVHANTDWNGQFYGAKDVLPPDILIRKTYKSAKAAPLLAAVSKIPHK